MEFAFDTAGGLARAGSRGRVDFARHFGLLAAIAAALAIAGPLGGLGVGGRFALYGALHAAALVLSIGGAADLAPARRLLLVAASAMLALSIARLGLFALHAVGALGGASGPCTVLAASAGLGALAYGALIGAVLRSSRGAADPSSTRVRAPFGLLSLGATSLGCAGATTLSFAVSRELHAASLLWLAVPWWFAFSAGLWCAHLASKSIR